MKLVCVHGSPRKTGNSSKIADRLCASIQAKGHIVKSYYLNRLKYIGCQSCMGCKGKSEICVLQDDLTEVLSEVKSADIIVLASPIFFGDLSAQMKGFIDRTYSYLKPDYTSRLFPGKKLVMILSQTAETMPAMPSPLRISGHLYPVSPQSNPCVRRRHCLLYTSPSPPDRQKSRMPSSA